MRTWRQKLLVLGSCLGFGLLSACESASVRTDEVVKEMDRSLEQGIASQPATPLPPPEVAAALMPKITVGAGPERSEVTERFEITVHNSPAKQFFMSLVEGTALNMVVHPEVSGSITLELKNVGVNDVMEILRDVYGYDFRRTRFGYEVLPARIRSRVFQVDFLNMRRTGTSRTRVSSGRISGSGDADSHTTSSDEDTTDSSSQQGLAISGSEINTSQPETSFWEELANSINAILGGAPGRSVVVNPQSGVVVVRAMPEELREVEEYLRVTQGIVARQVIIEAKIIEVELRDGAQQGINWAGVVGVNGKTVTLGQTGGGSIFASPTRTSGIVGNSGVLNPAALVPILGTAASAFGGMFTAALALGDFNAFIELLETQGSVHVLSSPRIATMNNQKAVIKVGADEFFVTDVSSTTVTGTASTTTPSIELTPFFSGIALDVTPQISADGAVTLHVHPAISEVVDQQKLITVGGNTQTLPLALTTVRESDSIIRAKSGQVVVIGGLMQNRTNDDDASVPGVGDLPGIGGLFRHKRKSVRKSELVILLRPTVVDSGRQWANDMRRTKKRLDEIRMPRQQK